MFTTYRSENNELTAVSSMMMPIPPESIDARRRPDGEVLNVCRVPQRLPISSRSSEPSCDRTAEYDLAKSAPGANFGVADDPENDPYLSKTLTIGFVLG